MCVQARTHLPDPQRASPTRNTWDSSPPQLPPSNKQQPRADQASVAPTWPQCPAHGTTATTAGPVLDVDARTKLRCAAAAPNTMSMTQHCAEPRSTFTFSPVESICMFLATGTIARFGAPSEVRGRASSALSWWTAPCCTWSGAVTMPVRRPECTRTLAAVCSRGCTLPFRTRPAAFGNADRNPNPQRPCGSPTPVRQSTATVPLGLEAARRCRANREPVLSGAKQHRWIWTQCSESPARLDVGARTRVCSSGDRLTQSASWPRYRDTADSSLESQTVDPRVANAP